MTDLKKKLYLAENLTASERLRIEQMMKGKRPSSHEILKRKRFLAELYELEKKYNMSLYIDEAYGPTIDVGDIQKYDVNENGEVVYE